MRIVLATDTFPPDVNGVARTLATTTAMLRSWGHQVEVIKPHDYTHVALPGYQAVKLAFTVTRRDLAPRLRGADAIHIATEGPIGLVVRRYCRVHGLAFTTSYHTNFPEYLRAFAGVPTGVTYAYLRWFHRPATRIMVVAAGLAQKLRDRGFRNRFARWSRGVDLSRFGPRADKMRGTPPRALYVGRVSVEKSIEDFLRLEGLQQTVVGDGPHRAGLEARWPAATFRGALHGTELAAAYADADVFVFPSRSDTFGLVVLEALASGVPVAAYVVDGPRDILINNQGLGHIGPDLAESVRIALATGNPAACIAHAKTFTWEAATTQFLNNLAVNPST